MRIKMLSLKAVAVATLATVAGTLALTGTAQADTKSPRAAATISIATNKQTYYYNDNATVTAHIGATVSRTLSIVAQQYGGGKVTIKKGTVDSHGNLTTTFHVTRSTNFSAVFGGDSKYAPKTVTLGVRSYAKVGLTQGRYISSVNVGSTPYKLYHSYTNPLIKAVVQPTHANECVSYFAQIYTRGAWRNLTTASCVRTSSASAAFAELTGSHPTNLHYRVRAEFVHPASDGANVNTYSYWTYFAFTSR
ncbi:hypothetical protein [Streptomyces sp. CA-111067]|jgi:hypothetical protein|uniref:hypothetical protein n=1 Tax=Streptomyces sp. CA-111067 TaxID=3240046 RepID=UPI003D9977F0